MANVIQPAAGASAGATGSARNASTILFSTAPTCRRKQAPLLWWRAGEGKGEGSCVCVCLMLVCLIHSPLSREPVLASPSRCARTLQWTMAAAALAKALTRLQGARCERNDSLLLDTLGLALGGQINLASLALAHAVVQGRPLVLVGKWRYADGPTCGELLRMDGGAPGGGRAVAGEGGRECFFKAKVGCASGLVAGVRGEERMRARGEGGDVLEHTDTEAVRGGLAPRAALRAHGLFWWTVQLQSFLTYPSLDLLARKRAAQQGLGLGGGASASAGVVGLHVRHGDACVHAAQVSPDAAPTPVT